MLYIFIINICRIFISYIILEGMFYSFHYSLHTYFYKYHKDHHKLIEKKNMLGVGALYMGWIEFIFTIFLLPLLYGILSKIFLHQLTMMNNRCDIFVAILSTWLLIDSHSHKSILNNKKHNLHHKYGNCNYGFGLYIFDRVFNTLRK